ncbi:MAG: hypothetical protein DCC46_12800 [Armatimonadetes bacterium]|nr:MAG: hypothetical protein DCC46_12800 [Armatimonadota bacterium]
MGNNGVASKMRSAFTLLEVLIVTAIVGLIAAISYPVILSAKRGASQAACISNLRQIGTAIRLYQESWGRVEYGVPWEMGLPENRGVAMNGVYLQCRGNNPKGSFYAQNFPNTDSLQGMIDEWTRYVRDVGPGAIIYFDENHQSNWPKSYQFENWKIIGLRLDGSVIVRTRLGFPRYYRWWHDR